MKVTKDDLATSTKNQNAHCKEDNLSVEIKNASEGQDLL